MFIWKNISSARQDPGRIQARSRLTGEIFSHVNACEILCGKASKQSKQASKQKLSKKKFAFKYEPDNHTQFQRK